MSVHSCQEFNGKLEAFADGELTADDRAAIEQHLAACSDCRSAIERMDQWKKRTQQAVRTQAAPLGLETRIRSAIRQGVPLPWWRRPALSIAFAAAAVLTLTAGLGITVVRPMRAQIASVLALGTGDHIHCTLERKQPPPGQLNRPLPGHHDEIVPVAKNALPAGFELLESHFCRFRGRVFTHIVFGRSENRLSVIITQKQSGEVLPKSALLARMKADGIPVFASHTAGLETLALETPRSWGFVVSDLDENTNQQVVAALARTIVTADRQ